MERTGTHQPMDLGVWYDFRNPVPWRIGWQQLYNETLDQARWAEELGFNSVWLSEHHFTDDGYMPSIPTALAAIAARTERVRLGTAVLLAPLHHPLRLAEDLAVVDLISNGRLDVGLAAGYRSKEFEVMAVPRTERGQRTEETVQILRLAWAGEEFSFQRQELPLPGCDGHAPACSAARTADLPRRQQRPGGPASRPARAAASPPTPAAPWISTGSTQRPSPSVDGGLAAPEIKANRLVHVTDDPERAWRLLGPHLLYQNNVYAQWAREAGDPNARQGDLTDPAQLPKDSFLIGTPEQVLVELKAVFAEGPVTEVIFWARPPGMTLDDSSASLQLIADQVLPALAAAAGSPQ